MNHYVDIFQYLFSAGWNLTKGQELGVDPDAGYIRTFCQQTDMTGRSFIVQFLEIDNF